MNVLALKLYFECDKNIKVLDYTEEYPDNDITIIIKDDIARFRNGVLVDYKDNVVKLKYIINVRERDGMWFAVVRTIPSNAKANGLVVSPLTQKKLINLIQLLGDI